MSTEKGSNNRVPEDYTASLKGDNRASEYRAQVVLDLIYERGLDESRRIVDVGCGYGILLYKLQKAGYNNTLGIDPISKVIESLKSEGVSAQVGDLEKGVGAIDDESVDVVVCLEVLEHLYDPAGALKEINRWLRPGGLLIASVPNAYRLRQRLNIVIGETTSDVNLVGGHIKFFNWDTFPSMVEESGFTIKKEFGEGGMKMQKMIPGYMTFLRRLPQLLAKWIFVIATKE